MEAFLLNGVYVCTRGNLTADNRMRHFVKYQSMHDHAKHSTWLENMIMRCVHRENMIMW